MDIGPPPHYRARPPLAFMDLQDTRGPADFFERRGSAYQVEITVKVTFDAGF